jgi:hypothetical protein
MPRPESAPSWRVTAWEIEANPECLEIYPPVDTNYAHPARRRVPQAANCFTGGPTRKQSALAPNILTMLPKFGFVTPCAGSISGRAVRGLNVTTASKRRSHALLAIYLPEGSRISKVELSAGGNSSIISTTPMPVRRSTAAEREFWISQFGQGRWTWRCLGD